LEKKTPGGTTLKKGLGTVMMTSEKLAPTARDGVYCRRNVPGSKNAMTIDRKSVTTRRERGLHKQDQGGGGRGAEAEARRESMAYILSVGVVKRKQELS